MFALKNMSSKRPQLANDEIYHLVLRSVGDTRIFNNENDYYRGIFSIYELNNSNVVDIWLRRQQRKREKLLEGPTLQNIPQRDLLVEILAFSFMPNHIHLLVRQVKNNGVSQFMQKLGTGYAVYFNKKYNRKGHLFNRFRAVHIKSEEQLRNVFVYIHTNRISIIEPGWKEKGITNYRRITEFLENDKWHSYPDYLGKNNFNSVTSREFLSKILGGVEGCQQAVDNWVTYKNEFADFDLIAIE